MSGVLCHIGPHLTPERSPSQYLQGEHHSYCEGSEVSVTRHWPRAEDQQSLKSNPSWRNSNKYVFYDWIEKLRMRVSLRDEIKRFVWSLCYGTGERNNAYKRSKHYQWPRFGGRILFQLNLFVYHHIILTLQKFGVCKIFYVFERNLLHPPRLQYLQNNTVKYLY